MKQLLLCCSLWFATGVVAQTNLDTVTTVSGLVSGKAEGSLHVFKGIPFAAPPVGNLRWKAPQPAASWDGVRKCDAFGPSPMQGKPVPFSMWSAEFLIPAEPISEDCLYLNVWTGAKNNREKRPVLIWIYGGGFGSGGSAVPIYDGEAMAKQGIVFVSINYRVGVFGFFAHPELSAESPQKASGNYGLMDQIAALKWVQQNIAAFGGDPANVTIAGQSAGAMSVNCLVSSPQAKGLFNKAIAQSGGLFTKAWVRLPEAETAGARIAEKLSAKSIEALRQIPADTLLKKAQGIYRPIIDGYVMPDAIVNIFAEGKQNKVALLTGWNEDEGLLFGPIKKADDYKQQMAMQYGKNADALLAYYTANSDSDAARSQLNLSRDLIFGAHNFTWANMQAAQGDKPVYMYRFTRIVPATGEYKKYGAFHTGEVPYAFDNLRFVNRPWEEADHRLAKAMSSYWAAFVKTGNPNGNGQPKWPKYSGTKKEVMMLGETQHVASLPDAPRLAYLYSIL